MARLQDFSDVTPSSSSDKLLIVQSAGQGLATLDTAGQQIANNTSVSQLKTTRKTLVGAVNEVDKELNEKITREYIAVCGSTANGFRRLDVNLNTIGTRTVTINSVLTAGDATDHKSKFNLDNRTAQGTFGLYTTDTSIVSGRPYIVNFTLS